MTVLTRSQKMAQAAFKQVQERAERKDQFKEYSSFSKKFPALIHTCGLVQAVAFAQAKDEGDYIHDLEAVLKAGGHAEIPERSLDRLSRTEPLGGYLRLSRDSLAAATWLKRYVEALAEDD